MKVSAIFFPISLLLLVACAVGFGFGYVEFASPEDEQTSAFHARDVLINDLKAEIETLRNEIGPLRDENLQLLDELNRTRTDQHTLRQALSEAQQGQEERSSDQTRVSENLDRVRRSLDEDVYTSTVRTVINPDETLVTGGFKTQDGRRVFAAMKPRWVTHKGARMIKEERQIFHTTAGQLQAAGLETMATNAGNVIQHGQLWQSDALASHLQKYGVAITEIPGALRPAISRGGIEFGDYKIWTTPYNEGDTAGPIDMEMTIEIQRAKPQ